MPPHNNIMRNASCNTHRRRRRHRHTHTHRHTQRHTHGHTQRRESPSAVPSTSSRAPTPSSPAASCRTLPHYNPHTSRNGMTDAISIPPVCLISLIERHYAHRTYTHGRTHHAPRFPPEKALLYCPIGPHSACTLDCVGGGDEY